MLEHLSCQMSERPGHKAALAAALLQKERLQLWWGCVGCLQAGGVGLEVVSLLLSAVARDDLPVSGDGDGECLLGISASRASEVRLPCARVSIGDAVGTCDERATHWLPTGFPLALHWLPTGFLLASYWLPTGFILTSYWLPTAVSLASHWQRQGSVRVFAGCRAGL
jgi:hypothetical protein